MATPPVNNTALLSSEKTEAQHATKSKTLKDWPTSTTLTFHEEILTLFPLRSHGQQPPLSAARPPPPPQREGWCHLVLTHLLGEHQVTSPERYKTENAASKLVKVQAAGETGLRFLAEGPSSAARKRSLHPLFFPRTCKIFPSHTYPIILCIHRKQSSIS